METQYELTYLIDPQGTEEARDGLTSAAERVITDAGGSLKQSAPMQRRNLAYEIKNKKAAFVRSLNIELNPEKLLDVQTAIAKTDGVNRVMVIKTQPRARIAPEVIERNNSKKKGTEKTRRPKRTEEKKEAKKVTMKDVEKGIEEALTEEVK